MPGAPFSQLASSLVRFTASNSQYPRGLSSSAARSLSVRMGKPPSASICIIMDVPERGKPETRVTNFGVLAVIHRFLGVRSQVNIADVRLPDQQVFTLPLEVPTKPQPLLKVDPSCCAIGRIETWPPVLGFQRLTLRAPGRMGRLPGKTEPKNKTSCRFTVVELGQLLCGPRHVRKLSRRTILRIL